MPGSGSTGIVLESALPPLGQGKNGCRLWEHLKNTDFDHILWEEGKEGSESGLYAQGVAGVEIESGRLALGLV